MSTLTLMTIPQRRDFKISAVGSNLLLLISAQAHMCVLRYAAIQHSPSERPAKWGLLELAVMVRCDSQTMWHWTPPGGEECGVCRSPNSRLLCSAWGQEQGYGSDSQVPAEQEQA